MQYNDKQRVRGDVRRQMVSTLKAMETRGVYPMLFALFGTDGQLDRTAMKMQVDAMVRSGAHGIAVLGLASESNKLSSGERRNMVHWVADALNGRLPLSVTIPGANIAEQVKLAAFAVDHGANWVILQPPPVTGVSETSLAEFFGDVARQVSVPVGIQIAPEYLGNSVSVSSAVKLNIEHPNLSILKVEMSGYAVSELKSSLGERFSVFNGQDGVDLPETIRGGCEGCIPGAECADVLAQIYDDLRIGTAEAEARADERYQKILPLISFLMRSIDNFLVYGKPILCRRLELPAFNASVRSPSGRPSTIGQEISWHWSCQLGPI
jgi:2-keto-3-deoxy-L-arabinonate dehydratase